MIGFPVRIRQRMPLLIGLVIAISLFFRAADLLADGKLVKPRDYKGSLEEKAQEAIIIFEGGDAEREAVEDLILKIEVAGKTDEFAWVIPFPKEPEIEKEDEALFSELFKYVEARNRRRGSGMSETKSGETHPKSDAQNDVEVISRKIVGSFDVAVVKENTAGTLNGWLTENGYQSLDDAEDVLSFYRKKGYVYACVRVSDAALGQADGDSVDLHPLRFTFRTGGRDGIFFPMKLTGLQTEPFDVNLYVFYGAWLNDELNQFGYKHRGFELRHRDWDTRECTPNAGKTYSNPKGDPYLRGYASRLVHTKRLMQKLHPGKRYYLTNIQAFNLQPENVRNWKDDLWLFPYYTNRDLVPYDARPEGVASASWPGLQVTESGETAAADGGAYFPESILWAVGGGTLGLVAGFLAAWLMFRSRGEVAKGFGESPGR